MTTYLSDYSNFKCKEEMDNATNQHISDNWNLLNNTDRAVLDMIRRYSVKHGAAHLKHETMEKTLGKSNSTIRRSLRKLESLSIIKRVKFIRKVLSGLGANIYTILPFNSKVSQSEMNSGEVAENSTVSKREAPKAENEPLLYKSSSSLVSNTYSSEPSSYPESFYRRFKKRIESMLGKEEQSLISKLYGIYKAQSIRMLKFSIYTDKGELFESLAMQAIQITLQASKKKPIRSLTGFYNGVYKKLISEHIIGFEDGYRGSQQSTEHDLEWFIPVHLQ